MPKVSPLPSPPPRIILLLMKPNSNTTSHIPNKDLLTVELKDRSYPIYVTDNAFVDFGHTFQQHLPSPRCVIITDDNVAKTHSKPVTQSLSRQNIQTHLLTVRPGEASKCMEVVERLFDQLFDLNLERTDTIIALGGGVVGDLAGFVAATYKRGVPFVQVPTTLLAMVDSSIGGKTGINHKKGKNMIGAFYQPRMVYADISALDTLPLRELSCGLAECVKHAVIKDTQLFHWLQKETANIQKRDRNLLLDLVIRNCRIKAAVVSQDETETDLRGILNFGHTIGHALEIALTDHDLHHGEAISLGMVAEARIAVKRDLLKNEELQKLIDLLKAFSLPTKSQTPLQQETILKLMRQDKKVHQGRIKFALPTALGTCTFVDDIDKEQIKWAIESLSK